MSPRVLRLRRAAQGVLAFTVAVILMVLVFLESVVSFVAANDLLFKLLGLVIAPLLAIVSFYWTRLGDAMLAEKSEEFGRVQAEAEVAKQVAAAERSRAEAVTNRLEKSLHDLKTIASSSKLWDLRENDPFKEYRGWHSDRRGAKIVTVGLFKGGVGKSHLTANFAAYVSEKRRKPVLIIDVDFQGSISTVVLTAAGIEPRGSLVDGLFAEGGNLERLSAASIHLAPTRDTGIALNKGKGLGQAWLVPADYTLAEVEGQLLVDRVVNQTRTLDERYRLSHILLNPAVRQKFAMILIDTPPRMTLGTVNALVASHALVSPIILDRVSSEALGPFLTQICALRKDLDLDLDIAGVVPSMTRQAAFVRSEQASLDQIAETLVSVLGIQQSEVENLLTPNLPRKVQVTNEDDLGYFLADNNGPLSTQFYDPIFDKLWERIVKSE
jgi:cellulose biosynthesis protein BcsQ